MLLSIVSVQMKIAVNHLGSVEDLQPIKELQ